MELAGLVGLVGVKIGAVVSESLALTEPMDWHRRPVVQQVVEIGRAHV